MSADAAPGTGADVAADRQDGFGLVDLALYAPIGALLTVREDLPRLVRDGRKAVEQRVVLARFIGRFAVEQGRRELTRRIEERLQQRRDVAVDDSDVAVAVPAPVAADDAVASAPGGSAPVVASGALVANADDLPIPEYESLAASQIVQRLATLHPAELDAVDAFERAHRNRRTVLGKISQLRGD